MAEGLECRSTPPQEATPAARTAPGTGEDLELGGYGNDEEEEKEEDLQQRRGRLCHAWRQQAKKARDKALKEAVTARKRKREEKTDHIMNKVGHQGSQSCRGDTSGPKGKVSLSQRRSDPY